VEFVSHAVARIRDELVVERRRAARYRVDAPASFSWADKQGGFQVGEGRTRDIGINGVYIVSSVCPPERVTIELCILLPALATAVRRFEVRAKGEVLRMDRNAQGNEPTGFAVASQTTSLAKDLLEKGLNEEESF
jgi:hypothetical protein